MIGGQDEDSCGKRGTGETHRSVVCDEEAQRPRKANSCTEINCRVTSS
ncbi:hypothetical protein [Priestia megaterium]|nr:hypothetical protein [Priestia megaterium]